MAGMNEDDQKLKIKLWLKANNFDYAWLAERCYVKEATVRNWMSKKPIPPSKDHIIRELMKQTSPVLPTRVHVAEETLITLRLDSDTRRILERRAYTQGKTLGEFLADEVPNLAQD